MAILDNSGDIILDAVLTMEGRRKLARGAPLNIRSFALADDEINYSTYQLDHPDGSAYEDLELLQTPVFEAMTGQNSRLNHPLIKAPGVYDRLYLPVAKVNEKITISSTTDPGASPSAIFESLGTVDGVFYIACTADTFTSFDTAITAGELPSSIGLRHLSNGYVGERTRGILVEVGLDSPELTKDRITEEIFLSDTGVLDGSRMGLMLDRRLFVGATSFDGVLSYNQTTGLFMAEARGSSTSPLGGPGGYITELHNYETAALSSGRANLYVATDPSVTVPVTNFSVLAGPTAFGGPFIFVPDINKAALSTGAVPGVIWSDLGTTETGAELFPGSTGTWASTNFKTINTTVYCSDITQTTGMQVNFVVKLIRKA